MMLRNTFSKIQNYINAHQRKDELLYNWEKRSFIEDAHPLGVLKYLYVALFSTHYEHMKSTVEPKRWIMLWTDKDYGPIIERANKVSGDVYRKSVYSMAYSLTYGPDMLDHVLLFDVIHQKIKDMDESMRHDVLKMYIEYFLFKQSNTADQQNMYRATKYLLLIEHYMKEDKKLHLEYSALQLMSSNPALKKSSILNYIGEYLLNGNALLNSELPTADQSPKDLFSAMLKFTWDMLIANQNALIKTQLQSRVINTWNSLSEPLKKETYFDYELWIAFHNLPSDKPIHERCLLSQYAWLQGAKNRNEELQIQMTNPILQTYYSLGMLPLNMASTMDATKTNIEKQLKALNTTILKNELSALSIEL